MARIFEDVVRDINMQGWTVLNCMQFSVGKWRMNVQQRSERGGTLSVFSEFADGKTAAEAAEACLFNLKQSRNNPGKASSLSKVSTATTISQKQEHALCSALEAMRDALDARPGSDSGEDYL